MGNPMQTAARATRMLNLLMLTPAEENIEELNFTDVSKETGWSWGLASCVISSPGSCLPTVTSCGDLCQNSPPGG